MTDHSRYAAIRRAELRLEQIGFPLRSFGVSDDDRRIASAKYQGAKEILAFFNRDENLSLSEAMREARRRTELGFETWVVVSYDDDQFFVMMYDPLESWHLSKEAHDKARAGWRLQFGVIETAVCRLVTPAEGEALLRGGG